MFLKGSVTLFFIATLFAQPVFSLEESTVKNTIINYMENGHKCGSTGQDFWQRVTVKTPLSQSNRALLYNLRFSKFGCELGVKGSLMISPGRSESSPEYYETAIDYVNRGYSPVYVIDHRGQGLSPRLLPNLNKAHVENFQDYADDFHHVVEYVKKDLSSFYDKKPLYLTSNSMGTAIALAYMNSYKHTNPFRAAAFFGSMIRVNYLSFIEKDPTILNNLIYSEFGVKAQGTWACNTGKCTDYARGKVFGDYVRGSRVYDQSLPEAQREKYMTHSSERYNLRTYIWENFDWSPIVSSEYQNDRWSNPIVGGATFSWTLTTTRFLNKMKKKRFLKRFPAKTPFLLLTGENDLRAYKPYKDGTTDLSRHINFCEKVNKFNRKNQNLCTFKQLDGAFHEIYKESDEYRLTAIDMAIEFFDQNAN